MQTPAVEKKVSKAEDRLSTERLIEKFKNVRKTSLQIVEPLETEDFVIQVMTQTSPTKWHLAHVSWFFVTFVLNEAEPDYKSPFPQYDYIFNSYYLQTGQPHDRSSRGFLSRPTVQQVFEYRRYVNGAISDFLENAGDEKMAEFAPVIEIGINHEQQHQELMITDLKFMLAQNPLYPVYRERKNNSSEIPDNLNWIRFDEGIYQIGNAGNEFTYDNEHPRHRQFLESFELADRPITNREYLQFIDEEGYERSELWLDDGWAAINKNKWKAPLYWVKRDDEWYQFSLSGLRKIGLNEPVTHISYYEADAFARWADARLPTEAEWETASDASPIEGTFLESEAFHPQPAATNRSGLKQLFGDVWEWTKSSYEAYPGYKPLPGALGEYNGKFMASQYVLRGGSCATPQSHIRKTYRNFFYPDSRWQFSGIRLAKTI